MTKVLIKVNNKVMATDGKLMVGEKQEGSLLKNLLDNTKTCFYLFYNYRSNNLIDLIQYNDTENVVSFSSMFYGCNGATSFPSINTSNGTSFNSMYRDAKTATEFPPLNTPNGTDFFVKISARKS